MKKEERNFSSGFTLMEVMIALMLFGIFFSVYISVKGYVRQDSTQMRSELELQRLAERVINEIIVNPPPLDRSLLIGKPDVKKFDDFPNFTYTVRYKEFKIPDINKLKEKDPNQALQENESLLEKMISEKVVENIEKLVWQVEVEIRNEDSGLNYLVSTWLYNREAQIDFNF